MIGLGFGWFDSEIGLRVVWMSLIVWISCGLPYFEFYVD